jgi:hypothetical protein
LAPCGARLIRRDRGNAESICVYSDLVDELVVETFYPAGEPAADACGDSRGRSDDDD